MVAGGLLNAALVYGLVFHLGGGTLAIAMSTAFCNWFMFVGLAAATRTVWRPMLAGLPLPAGLSATLEDIRSGTRDYQTLYRDRRRIRTTYMLLLFVLTTLVFFASSWLAIFLSKQVTRPVEALADAMDAVAAGRYARVKVVATEELGELVQTFNRMAEDLDESRALAETSATQLSAANRAFAIAKETYAHMPNEKGEPR